MRALQMSFLKEEFINLTDCRDEMSPKEIRDLYRKAVSIAAEFQQKEIELIDVLKELDSTKVYRISGMNSLYSFATEVLKLSENQAFTYITLARKCAEVPEVQAALAAKEISISKARRLCSVIDKSNKSEWLLLAKKSSSKELDRAIRSKDPRALVYDSVKYLSDKFLSLSATIDEETAKNLSRVKELMMSHCSARIDYNEMLKEMTELYLDRFDPLRKAERAILRKTAREESASSAVTAGYEANHAKQIKEEQAVEKTSTASVGQVRGSITELVDRRVTSSSQPRSARVPIKAELKHLIFKRDQGQCRFHMGPKRCQSRVHLECHHIVPVSQGGEDTAENLILLCSSHHQWVHMSK